MTSLPTLDYSALTRRVGLRARLRAAGRDNVAVATATVAMLLVVIPAIIFIALVATGNATDGGGLAVLGMVFAGGLWVLGSLLGKAKGLSVLQAFADANHLTLLRDRTVEHYRGSLFASGECAIRQAVRIDGPPLLEVGDRISTTTPRRNQPNVFHAYVRLRLDQRVDDIRHEIITPETDRGLTSLLGPYTFEVSGEELTVFGDDALAPDKEGRVESAFELAGAIADRCASLLAQRVAAGELPATSTTSGIPIPDLSAPDTEAERTMGPWRTFGLVLGFVLVVPVILGVAMSLAGDHLRGHRSLAGFVVSIVVLVSMVAVGWLLRVVLKPRKGKHSRQSG